MVMGGVVPVVNLPGIKPGELKLDGTTLADIYLGKITKWNDPAIAKLNPGVNLPDKAIATVHRSDGSGTTFIFTHYLSKVEPGVEGQGRREHLGRVARRARRQGQRGRRGADVAHRRRDRLCRIRLCAAEQDDLRAAEEPRRRVRRRPSIKSFQAAAANADWSKAPGFYLLLTDQPGKESWPITGATFILMHKQQAKPETAKRGARTSSTGPTTTAARWPSSSTTCRCRRPSSRLVEESWKQIVGRRRQAGLDRPRLLTAAASRRTFRRRTAGESRAWRLSAEMRRDRAASCAAAARRQCSATRSFMADAVLRAAGAADPRRRHRRAGRRRAAGVASNSASASSSPSRGTRSPRNSARWRRSTAPW